MTAPTTAPAAEALATVRGGLIVSCQAPPGDPASGPEVMRALALSVLAGGAVAIRAEGLDDLAAIRGSVAAPIIGLWKYGTADVYITPTAEHAVAVARTGVELVAVDGTARPRPDGQPLAATITAVHDAGAGVVADVATVEEGLAAADLGADAVATTLAGYAHVELAGDDRAAGPQGGPSGMGPDLAVVRALASRLTVPVIAEGRYTTAEQVSRAFDAGAWAVVVGTAITRPQLLTRGFVAALPPRAV